TRGRMLAPMVKDVWNVNDDPRLIGGAQREIIILREIELLAPTAEFLHQRAPVNGNMTEIHARVEQCRTPFRFKEWRMPFSFCAQTIFIAVENLAVRLLPNCLCELIQCCWR